MENVADSLNTSSNPSPPSSVDTQVQNYHIESTYQKHFFKFIVFQVSATSQPQQQPTGLAKLMQQSAWAGRTIVTEIKSEPSLAASQVTVKLPTASNSFGVLGSGGLPTRRPSSHSSSQGAGRGGGSVSRGGSHLGSTGQQRKHQQPGNVIKLKQLVSGPGRPKKVADGEATSSLANSPALDSAATSSESSGDASSSPSNIGTSSSTSAAIIENELLDQQMAVEENRDDVMHFYYSKTVHFIYY